MHKVAFETLGCRLNQAETAILQDRFLARGYSVIEDPREADLYVLHTCTLTAHSTAKCRRHLRRVIRANPQACVAAIGCYAQTDAAELANIPGVDYVVGTAEKLRLAEIIAAPAKRAQAVVINPVAGGHSFTIEGGGYYPLNTRANLKIQEGCDFVCAFCIIPRSRGRARSRDFHDILREARSLCAAGHREIVITGVNIGTYREGGHTLADVIAALEDIDGLDRIRISSIEPTTVDAALLDRMAAGGKLCPYLHLPAQSGDGGVLARMRRRYDAEEFTAFLRDATARVPGLGLGTDVIVGFPGEDEAAFARSCELVAAFPFVNVHVFSFSARPRTSAFAMAGRIDPAEIRRRSDRLHRLALSVRHDAYASRVGRTARVLFEVRDAGGAWVGYSDDYVRVRVESPEDLHNRMGAVEITGVDCAGDGDRTVARANVLALEPCAPLPAGASS